MASDAVPQAQVEGLDEGSRGEHLSAYPLDDVLIRSETRTVSEIVRRIEAGRYSMNPDFQREFVWPPDKQSKLIESCVMRIPLPVLYVAEGEDGKITVVDGLQRLSTFQVFLANKLRLVGFGTGHPLEGKRYDDLPVSLRERIEDTQLTLYILDKNAPEAARLDIFDRVNSGIPLSRQQMRNALYNGSATRWLAAMADHPEFLSATGGTLSRSTMRDREAINRFAAFHVLGWESYSGDMDEFLAKSLSAINRFDPKRLDTLTADFVAAMARNKGLFGRHAFRKSLVELEKYANRSVINISMFDTFSFYFARLDGDRFLGAEVELKAAIRSLMRDPIFVHSVTYSTNSTVQVKTRFGMMAKIVEHWLK